MYHVYCTVTVARVGAKHSSNTLSETITRNRTQDKLLRICDSEWVGGCSVGDLAVLCLWGGEMVGRESC